VFSTKKVQSIGWMRVGCFKSKSSTENIPKIYIYRKNCEIMAYAIYRSKGDETIIIIIIIIIIIADKQSNCQELANEVCAIPIVISSTGVIPNSLSQSLTRLNLHPNTYIQMQKSVILGTCSVVRNFSSYK
jgi:hypothetical protein